MIDWLTGRQVGCTRNTSFSRTLSRMRTKMFSFANWKTSAWPGSLFSQWAIFRASSGLALPW